MFTSQNNGFDMKTSEFCNLKGILPRLMDEPENFGGLWGKLVNIKFGNYEFWFCQNSVWFIDCKFSLKEEYILQYSVYLFKVIYIHGCRANSLD